MLKFLEKPCLPENRVASVLISAKYEKFIKILSDIFNIDSFPIVDNDMLTEDISSHADCIFTQIDDKAAIIDKNCYSPIVNYLTSKNLNKAIKFFETTQPVKSPYPDDIRLNVRIVSNKIFCNSKHIDENLHNYVLCNDMDIIHCNQGYAACSTIILNDNAMITDDESILNSAQLNGIDCIYVRKGSVKLLGREYGFIGGTCGMIDKNLIAFTGKLDSHIDSYIIKSFLHKHNVNYIELTDDALVDIGGIIPILEQCP